MSGIGRSMIWSAYLISWILTISRVARRMEPGLTGQSITGRKDPLKVERVLVSLKNGVQNPRRWTSVPRRHERREEILDAATELLPSTAIPTPVTRLAERLGLAKGRFIAIFLRSETSFWPPPTG